VEYAGSEWKDDQGERAYKGELPSCKREDVRVREIVEVRREEDEKERRRTARQ